MLVYDVKNELWDITAGLRSTIGYCAFFNPTEADSTRFNPLFEIRKGDNEIRDTQNIVEMLVNPTGMKHTMDIWDQQASQFLVALILHVLYTEAGRAKESGHGSHAPAGFQEHRQGDDPHAAPVQPADRRTGVAPRDRPGGQGAAPPAGEVSSQRAPARQPAISPFGRTIIIARNTASSDFRLSDLVCADKPMTLYLQPPPSDAPRLRPLVRLIINQTCRALMEHLDRDSAGRSKKRRLLLSLDEFPTLGRLDFFTMNLRQMAGYGIKAHLIVQSFNDIVEQYGVNNTILDNCHILTAFAAADTVTCQRISQMTGTVTEYRESYSQAARGIGARTVSQSEQVRPLLSPGDVRELSVEDELIFVTGYKPMRAKKARYYADPVFMKRVLPAHDQSQRLNLPDGPRIDWLHERAKGPELPLPREAKSSNGDCAATIASGR